MKYKFFRIDSPAPLAGLKGFRVEFEGEVCEWATKEPLKKADLKRRAYDFFIKRMEDSAIKQALTSVKSKYPPYLSEAEG